jgi:hypothetical protein
VNHILRARILEILTLSCSLAFFRFTTGRIRFHSLRQIHQTCLPLRDRRTRRTQAEEEVVAVEEVALQVVAEAYLRDLAKMYPMQETAETVEEVEVEAGAEDVAPEEGAGIETEHSRKAKALRSLSLPNNPLLLVWSAVAWSKMLRLPKLKKSTTRICASSVLRTSTTTV